MNLPTLTESAVRVVPVTRFLGVNRGTDVAEGEFAAMRNLSDRRFPRLSPRSPRGIYAESPGITGLIAKDTLCYTDGEDFVVNGYRLPLGLSDAPKQLVSMGAYVIILPDRKYVNTANVSDRGDIEAEFAAEGMTVTLCAGDGTAVTPDVTQPQSPENPAEGTVWLDTGVSPAALRQWSESTGVWTEFPASYVCLSAPGLGSKFAAGDGVSITGLGQHPELTDGTAVVAFRDTDSLVIPGLVSAPAVLADTVTVSRRMPALDFVTESGNRLWGCRYGLSADGQPVNEICASKLGDFRNWSCFQGVSTDSYTVSVGTDGPFTGAVNHLGSPLFFKETCLHRVYGGYPAAYQVQTVLCPGVCRGSEASLAEVEGVLYYHAPDGVYAYDGSLPRSVSAALGTEPYRNAAAGSLGGRYYISMADAAGSCCLYVYDTHRGLWHIEDEIHARCFARARGELYFLAEGKICTVCGSGEPEASPVAWMAETGVLGSTLGTYLSRLRLRLSLPPGSTLQVSVAYDGEESWHPVCALTGGDLRSVAVPVALRRCGSFRLRLEGRGDCQVYGLEQLVAVGSDRFRPEGVTLGGSL